MRKTQLLGKTQGLGPLEGKSLDEIVTYIARVSSTRLNRLENPSDFIEMLLMQGHVSPFEMVNLVIEIKSSRAIHRQILRHQLHVQEFSQRYSTVLSIDPIELRRKEKRRQSSEVILTEIDGVPTDTLIEDRITEMQSFYRMLLDNLVARESARMFLPEATQSTAIYNGVLRNWLTFLNSRMTKHAQKEVRVIANEVFDILTDQAPSVMQIFNKEKAYDVPILDQLILKKYGFE